MPEKINWYKVIRRDNSPLFQYLIVKSFDNLASSYEVDVHFNHYRYLNRDIYTSLDELKEVEEELENIMLVDRNFPLKKYLNINKLGQELLKFTANVAKVEKFTKQQKIDLFKKFCQLHLKFDPYFRFTYPYGKIFEKRSKFILKYELSKRKQKAKIENVFENFMIPYENPILSLENENLSRLALLIKQGKSNIDDVSIQIIIKRHIEKFSFLSFNAGLGKKLTKENIVQSLEQELNKEVKVLVNQVNWFKNVKNKSKKLLKQLKIGYNFSFNVEMMQRFIYLRLYVKEVVEKSYYDIYNLLTSIGAKYKLTYSDIIWLIPDEIINLINRGNSNYKAVINERKKAYAIDREYRKIRIIIGKKIKDLKQRTETITSGIEEVIKGMTACKGKIKGKVKIVRYSPECSKVEKGDILLAPMTTPEFVTALKRAGAVVTDEGGITCHAAIVSRELNIPCVIGTKIATRVLKDGDLVEVDATKGIVKKL